MSKKQKVGYFPDVSEIPFEGPDSTNPLSFKFYNKDEVILGKPMREWLRFAVCYWHTWRGNGADIFGLGGTANDRPWSTENTLEGALERVDVHFEFCTKLGIDYYCFHDRDVAPKVRRWPKQRRRWTRWWPSWRRSRRRAASSSSGGRATSSRTRGT